MFKLVIGGLSHTYLLILVQSMDFASSQVKSMLEILSSQVTSVKRPYTMIRFLIKTSKRDMFAESL